MRRYGTQFLVILIILVSAWLVLPIIYHNTLAWLKMPAIEGQALQSVTDDFSLAYPIKANQLLKFPLAEDSTHLRIITNAHIQPDEAKAINPNWIYAIHYELLDKDEVIIKSGAYHLHSQLTLYKNPQGQMLYGNYYAIKNTIPLDGRFIVLKLEGIKKAAFLQVRFEALNPAITETAVRVYVPTKISEHQLATSWLRMSQEQRTRLAKSSIYPEFLLSDAEKVNLLNHQWHGIGPLGIEGTDYQTQTLYSRDDANLEAVNEDKQITAPGLVIDAQHYGVIPLPEQGGQLNLTFKALDGSALQNPIQLNLQWFGRNQDQRWQQNASWTKTSTSLDYTLAGGLLVIRPSAQAIVNAYLTTTTEPKHEITDALLSIKTYKASFGIDFGVLHYQNQAAALRIDVRKLLTSNPSPQQAIHYQLLDAKQQIIGSGDLTTLSTASLFDRLDTIFEGINVSDPTTYYFHLPAQVSQIRLFADKPDLLVSAYNQPYGHSKQQRIPEDAYFADNDTRDQQLAWFPLRALNDENLTLQQAVQWISGQYRPPEDNPDVLAGDYLWQDFIPEGEAAGRYILTDYAGNEPRSDALANIYCTLPANQPVQVKLDAVTGLRSVAPELLYLRPSPSPFTADMFFNQQKIAAINSMGKQGFMYLPQLPLGDHELRLQTESGGNWYMNHQTQCTGQRYLKRRVFSLNPTTHLDFIVEHSGADEVFSAHVYSPSNMSERSQINVEIQSLNATPNKAMLSTTWTYQHRAYDIRPMPNNAMPILYSQGQTMGNGERFAIPINADLPAGTYRLRLSLAKGAAGHITLSQIKAGKYDQRRFYREIPLAH